MKFIPPLAPSAGIAGLALLRVAGAMLKVDPTARSSMWEDLERGRRTEIDYLNGEIVRLAESLRSSAPVNGKIVELVHGAERGGRRDWKAALLTELTSY